MPNAAGLVAAAVITMAVVALSATWQPDAETPLMQQGAMVFLAAGLVLARFRRFRE